MTRLLALLALMALCACAGPSPPPVPTGIWQPINGGWTATQQEMEALPK